MDWVLFGQILGFGGLIGNILCYQIKTGRGIILAKIPTNLFWIMHYVFLANPVAAMMPAIGVFRNIIGLHVSDRYLPHLMISSIAAVWGGLFLFGDGGLVILPAIATSLFSTTILFRDNSLYMRSVSFICCFMWLIFAASIGSYAGVISDIIVMTSILIGALRHETIFAPFRNKFIVIFMPRARAFVRS